MDAGQATSPALALLEDLSGMKLDDGALQAIRARYQPMLAELAQLTDLDLEGIEPSLPPRWQGGRF